MADRDTQGNEVRQAGGDNIEQLRKAHMEDTAEHDADRVQLCEHREELSFILHMVENPEVQDKGHAELDRVVSRQRLPEIEDRSSLPYINAICKEVLRCYPVVPLGLPHKSTEEDQFKGMRIPKGTVMIPNIW